MNAPAIRLSVSQAKKFRACPSAWYGEYVARTYRPEDTVAFAQGTYFHALVLEPEKAPAVLAQKAEFLTLKGGAPNAYAKTAQEAAAALLAVPELADMLVGDREQEVWGDINGVPWMGRIDVLDRERKRFIDLKLVASLTDEQWVPRLRCRATFLHQHDYRLQVALYQQWLFQATKEVFEPWILAVSKPTPAAPTVDLRAFRWTDFAACDRACAEAWALVDEVRSAAAGDGTDLRRCEDCEWCRRTRTEWTVDVGIEPGRAGTPVPVETY